MTTVIFGAGKAGQHLAGEMKAFGKDEINAFLDNFADTSEPVQGIPVYRPDDYLKKHRPNRAILAAGSQKAIWLMIRKLQEYQVDDIWMLHEIAGTNHLPLYDDDGEFLQTRVRKIRFDREKPTLPYFEIPIIDDCNLNCKGCLFNCNRHGEKSFMTLEEITFDFLRMKELFFDIPWIRILGGEPLLHPQLADVVQMARDTFPDSEIDVCTNGLCVPSIAEDVLMAMREHRITVHISEYRPVKKIAKSISNRLKLFGIEHCFMSREEFYKFYTQAPTNNAEKSHELCPTCGCREVYSGRIVKCSAILAFERMNKQFGTHYETHENEEWFDLHDKTLTGRKILQKLDEAVSACRYCDIERKQVFPWVPGKEETLADYVVDI